MIKSKSKGIDMRIVVIMAIALSVIMAKSAIVTPTNSNLVWEDSLHNTEEKVTYNEAKEYCETLALGDLNDWRVPTLSELLTIVDLSKYKPAILKEFEHADDDTLYWSSTPFIGSKGDYWGVNFKDGATDNASGIYDRYVRCVRVVK